MQFIFILSKFVLFILFRALLRPGRFDITVNVQLPDAKGRKEIIEYYLGKLKQHGALFKHFCCILTNEIKMRGNLQISGEL